MTQPAPQRFNLVDEPWIPIEDHAGRVQLMSLAATFEHAARLRRVVDPSPIVTIALYRLLFAIFHRAYPLAGHDDWLDAWDSGSAHEHVGAYLATWRHRFDLFAADAPFWQVPDLDTSPKVMAWTKLAAELNDNNSKVLFDHTVTLRAEPASPERVARALVACQVMSVGGGNSTIGYNVHAPIATALVVVPEGPTLADTLLANVRVGTIPSDRPVWERDPPTADALKAGNDAKPVVERPFAGIADRLTWRTRSLRLVPPEDDQGVQSVHFGAGERAAMAEGDRDPWVPYRVSKEGTWLPRRWDLQRAVWRDLHAMIASKAGESTAPLVLADVGALASMADREVPTWTLLIAGQAADKAKINAWSQERWRVPSRLIEGEPGAAHALGEALARAEATADRLRSLAWHVAEDSLGVHTAPPKSTVRAAMERLPTLTTYWSVLEASFAQLLDNLGRTGVDDPLGTAHRRWTAAIALAVEQAERDTHRSLGRDAVAIRAWAKTGQRFAELARQLSREAQQQPGGST